ncbi:hypothetical protein FPV67DRAFT_1456923 [Lyophyllum atratum]|nr:hypothetical protein FPV67DRAFT_1456923 [Lyophyllum atratum]
MPLALAFFVVDPLIILQTGSRSGKPAKAPMAKMREDTTGETPRKHASLRQILHCFPSDLRLLAAKSNIALPSTIRVYRGFKIKTSTGPLPLHIDAALHASSHICRHSQPQPDMSHAAGHVSQHRRRSHVPPVPPPSPSPNPDPTQAPYY